MSVISLTLDALPPSSNAVWRAVGGKVLKSREFRQWLSATAWHLKAQAKGARIEGHYALHVQFRAPDKRRRDIDNLIGSLSDAIQEAGLVVNDCDCQRIKAEWVSEGPAVKAWLISTGETNELRLD